MWRDLTLLLILTVALVLSMPQDYLLINSGRPRREPRRDSSGDPATDSWLLDMAEVGVDPHEPPPEPEPAHVGKHRGDPHPDEEHFFYPYGGDSRDSTGMHSLKEILAEMEARDKEKGWFQR